MIDYIALDLETTGFSPEMNEIIETGAYKVRKGVVVDKFITFVKPVMYIPVSVQTLTGISMEDVDDAEPIEVVLPEFFEWCESLPFLGHNLKFDYSFLRTKGRYMGLDFSLGGSRQGICTLSLARKLLNLDNNTLGDLAAYFRVNLIGGSHRAGYDALTVKMVYERMLYKFGAEGVVSMPRLLDVNETQYGEVTNNDVLDFS